MGSGRHPFCKKKDHPGRPMIRTITTLPQFMHIKIQVPEAPSNFFLTFDFEIIIDLQEISKISQRKFSCTHYPASPKMTSYIISLH